MDTNDLIATIVDLAVSNARLRSENELLRREADLLRASQAAIHTPPQGEGPVEGPDSPEGGTDAG